MRVLTTVTVREHARLTTADLPANTLDKAQVSPTAFDWLCGLAARWRASGAQLLQVEDRRWLRMDNFVGVLQTPCGLQLEILPKHVDATDAQAMHGERQLLARMLETALDLPPRITDAADLKLFEHPLVEWVMRRFLLALDHVVQRGLRSDYLRVEEEQPFLRGQLDVVRQMRAPPGRAHHFQIRHDVFVVDRPENRLLKSALLRVRDAAREPDNWRLANELAHRLEEVPHSTDVSGDFRRWRTDRLIAHYQPVRPWCELVLGRHMPMALLGDTQGLSLLFPMEKLFERYVAAHLRRQLPAGMRLTEQSTRLSLCEHADKPFFQLRPDLLIEGQGRTMVLDSKWKRIDARRRDKSYDLDQADFYQLYAYGQKYMGGCGDMALIYPRTATFDQHLAPFSLGSDLRLWVLPFDLGKDELVSPDALSEMMFGVSIAGI